jgi:spore coat protein U-like protein
MNKQIASMFALVATVAAGNALAASLGPNTINVTAAVTEACSNLGTSDVDFGSAGQTETDTTVTSVIAVTCDNGTAYDVEIDYGITPQGTIRTVTGAGAGAAMDYYIFQPAAGGGSATTTPWGTGVEKYSGTGSGSVQNLTATFVLDRTSGATPDPNYSDAVSVTLNF